MCGWLDLRGSLMGGDLPEEPQGPGLATPFLAVTGERESALSQLSCLPSAAGQEVGLAEPGKPQRMFDDLPHGSGLLNSLLQQRQGLGDPPREGLGIPK